MSDSLTTLIGKVQNILGDSTATYFTTAICTAAIRQALTEINIRAPIHAAVIITPVNNQYEYELTDEDSNAIEILDILQQGKNEDELDISLTYDSYSEDERLFFRLRSPLTTSDRIIARYTLNHTINGLDSQVESTLRAEQDQIIVDGAAYYALLIRAASRVESVNLSKDQSDNYREIAGTFRRAFDAGLNSIAKKRAPVGEPDTRAWNDEYHTWKQ